MSEKLIRQFIMLEISSSMPAYTESDVSTILTKIESKLESNLARPKYAQHTPGYDIWVSAKLQDGAESKIIDMFVKDFAEFMNIPFAQISINELKPSTGKNQSGRMPLFVITWKDAGNQIHELNLQFRYRSGAGGPRAIGAGGYAYEGAIRSKIAAATAEYGIAVGTNINMDIKIDCPSGTIIGIESKELGSGARGESANGIGFDGSKFTISPQTAAKKTADLLAAISAAGQDASATAMAKQYIAAWSGINRMGNGKVSNSTIENSWWLPAREAREAVKGNSKLTTGRMTSSGLPQFRNLYQQNLGVEVFNTYYSKKGVQYVQVSGHGLFKTSGLDPLALGVPMLDGISLNVGLRVRDTGGKVSFRVESQIMGEPTTSSPVDLGADTFSVFVEKLIKFCGEGKEMTNESLLRRMIRETLLTEELTKTDKREIDKLIKKGIERDRAEQKRIMKKEIEAELKTSLGKSFFGNPGKVRKAIEEIARDELSREMRPGSDMEKSVVEITKKVLTSWHEMLYKQQNIINRIRIK